MKKHLIIILLLSIVSVCHSYGNDRKKSKPKKNSPVIFQGEVNANSIAKAELFYKAKRCIERYLEAGQEAIADKNSGIVLGRCYRKIFVEVAGINIDMVMHYTLRLEVKDNSAYYTISKISFESIPDQGFKSHTIYAEDWMNKQAIEEGRLPTDINKRYKMTTLVEVGEIIGEFSSSL